MLLRSGFGFIFTALLRSGSSFSSTGIAALAMCNQETGSGVLKLPGSHGGGLVCNGPESPQCPIRMQEWKEIIRTAVDALQQGSVIGVPTDTIYGIACLAQNSEAIRRIYEIKGRNGNKPLAICVGNVEDIYRYCTVTVPDPLLHDLLPGPVTLVFERSGTLNKDLNPFTPEFQDLWPRLALVIDGGRIGDACSPESRLGSTVVNLSIPGCYSIIRPGWFIIFLIKRKMEFGNEQNKRTSTLEEKVPAVTQRCSPIIPAEGVTSTDMLQLQDLLPALVNSLVQAAMATAVEALAEEVIPVSQEAEVEKPAMQERPTADKVNPNMSVHSFPEFCQQLECSIQKVWESFELCQRLMEEQTLEAMAEVTSHSITLAAYEAVFRQAKYLWPQNSQWKKHIKALLKGPKKAIKEIRAKHKKKIRKEMKIKARLDRLYEEEERLDAEINSMWKSFQEKSEEFSFPDCSPVITDFQSSEVPPYESHEEPETSPAATVGEEEPTTRCWGCFRFLKKAKKGKKQAKK
ncbi:yrdC domain-containing protein, mitochondrial isoform X2 [Latimeria chalumnae]|uniref:yrdC domain-containing protein, mitochondrial isoform X2 n=1 Tax=Latimeria chalumnae TaxID=7897 RepID=UPI00313B2C35